MKRERDWSSGTPKRGRRPPTPQRAVVHTRASPTTTTTTTPQQHFRPPRSGRERDFEWEREPEASRSPELLRSSSAATSSLAGVLEALAGSFLPCPDDPEYLSYESLLFPLEEAWWQYIDVYREELALSDVLPELSFSQFVHAMFSVASGLRGIGRAVEDFVPGGLDALVASFASFKGTVPCAGTVLLNKSRNHVLLVRGSWKGSWWGFPKGKMKSGEDLVETAVRETREETGLDVSGILSREDSVEVTMGRRKITLFIATDVDVNTRVAAVSAKEILSVGWHSFKDVAEKPLRYNGVKPFIKKIQDWLVAHKPAEIEQSQEASRGVADLLAEAFRRDEPLADQPLAPGYALMPYYLQ